MSTPDEQLATMIANFPEKTGKPLDAWVKIVAKSGLGKHGEIVKMLKAEHGMGHGFANLVAHTALKAVSGGDSGEEDPVAAQYAGDKAALRPIYDAITAYATSLGKDVEIAPKKTNVSIRRSKQFALIQPSTKTRLDLGINLKGVAPEGKLEASGSFSAMVSHRIRIEKPADFDKEAKAWLKKAYDAA